MAARKRRSFGSVRIEDPGFAWNDIACPPSFGDDEGGSELPLDPFSDF